MLPVTKFLRNLSQRKAARFCVFRCFSAATPIALPIVDPPAPSLPPFNSQQSHQNGRFKTFLPEYNRIYNPLRHSNSHFTVLSNSISAKQSNQRRKQYSANADMIDAVSYIETCVFGQKRIESNSDNGDSILWSDIVSQLSRQSIVTEPKQLMRLRKLVSQMPHIDIQTINRNNVKMEYLKADNHIRNISINERMPPMIEWNNVLDFDRYNRKQSLSNLKFLVDAFQLNNAFPNLTFEAKMILARGLNSNLNSAYNKLTSQRNMFNHISMLEYSHLYHNLGITPSMIVAIYANSHLNSNLNKYPKNFIKFCKSENLSLPQSESCIVAPPKISHFDVMPYLFEMKVLIKLGKLLQYININTDKSGICQWQNDFNRFDIHSNTTAETDAKLSHDRYRVYSEKQIENGECPFGKYRCTPDIVLSQPIWINKRPIYWIDAKCTRAANCVYDQKRRWQMFRFCSNYGAGAIVALGTADLAKVGIHDCVILDGCSWL